MNKPEQNYSCWYFLATKPLTAEEQFSFHTHKNINLKLYKQPLGLANLSVMTTDTVDRNTGEI